MLAWRKTITRDAPEGHTRRPREVVCYEKAGPFGPTRATAAHTVS